MRLQTTLVLAKHISSSLAEHSPWWLTSAEFMVALGRNVEVGCEILAPASDTSGQTNFRGFIPPSPPSHSFSHIARHAFIITLHRPNTGCSLRLRRSDSGIPMALLLAAIVISNIAARSAAFPIYHRPKNLAAPIMGRAWNGSKR